MNELRGYILSIDPKLALFTIRSHTDILCKYQGNVFYPKKYQSVIASGSYDQNYFLVEKITVTDIEENNSMVNTYRRMKNTISKNLDKLTRFYEPPNNIKRILVLSGIESELTISCFISQCSHMPIKIDIYRMIQSDICCIENVLSNDYDMIVFLCEDMTNTEIYLLSSRENIRYLINQNRQYICVVRPSDKLPSLIEYFCETFDSNEKCISMIGEIIESMETKINEMKELLITDAKNHIQMYRQRLDHIQQFGNFKMIKSETIRNCLHNQLTYLKLILATHCKELLFLLLSDNEEFHECEDNSYWGDKYLQHIDYYRNNPDKMLLAHHIIYNLCQEIKNTKK